MALFGFWKINRALTMIEKLSASRQFDDAERLIQGLIEKNPQDATLLLHAAVVAFEKGEIPKAQEITEAALKIQPDNPVLHLALGEILHKQQRYQDSINALKQSLLLSPGNPKAEYLLGINCIALNYHEEATQHFEKVAHEDKDFLLARLLTIGETLVAKK
jgi:predicted Zn-dependent protease